MPVQKSLETYWRHHVCCLYVPNLKDHSKRKYLDYIIFWNKIIKIVLFYSKNKFWIVVKLKSRTCRLLFPTSQLGFIVHPWYYHGKVLDARDPPRFVICVIMRTLGGGVVKLKSRTCRLLFPTSQLGFIVQRDHKWRTVVYVNSASVHGWIKIKQVVKRVNERWNVTTKRCELNSFHSNAERKKQEDQTHIPRIVNRVWRKRACKLPYCAIVLSGGRQRQIHTTLCNWPGCGILAWLLKSCLNASETICKCPLYQPIPRPTLYFFHPCRLGSLSHLG